MFIGRRNEIHDLKAEFDRQTPSLVLMYGRRRVGKSELIKEVGKDYPFVYFQATEDPPHVGIAAFKAAVEAQIGTSPVLSGLQDWEGILHYIARAAEDSPGLVVALDEFPYLCETYKPLPSVIQKFWDSRAAESGKLNLVLCGSAISAMKSLIGGNAPLYGRQTAKFDLRQMPLREISGFFPTYSAEQLVATYAMFGGIPFYLEKCDRFSTPEENIRNLMLSRNGALVDGPEVLTQSEVNEPAVYHAILSAIAAGKTKRGEIRDSVRTHGDIGGYLEKLARMHVAIAMKSIDADEFSRDSRYVIVDPMASFWYAFVRPNVSAIKIGQGDAVWNSRIIPAMGNFLGTSFEVICRNHVTLYGHEFLPSPAQKIGKIWRKPDYDIDIAGELLDGSHVYGEVKWTSDPIGIPILDKLIGRSEESGYGGRNGKHFVLFSKSGFTEDLQERAAKDSSVVLVGLSDLASLP